MLMAMTVLLSTMSFSVNKHYCMDMLVDVSLVLPADTCGMDMISTAAEEGTQLNNVPCCADEHIAFEGQDEVKPSAEWSAEMLQMTAVAFVYSYQMLFAEESTQTTPFRDYSPPLLVKDLPVIYETYLI